MLGRNQQFADQLREQKMERDSGPKTTPPPIPIGATGSASSGSGRENGVAPGSGAADSGASELDLPRFGFLNRDRIAFLISFVTHLTLLLIFGLIPILQITNPGIFLRSGTPGEESSELDLAGVSDAQANDMNMSQALETLSINTDLTSNALASDSGVIALPSSSENSSASTSSGMQGSGGIAGGGGDFSAGRTGVGVSGTGGAMDRLTYEIVKSIEVRPTTVVWLFDASFSLAQQREEIEMRFDRIYQEVGLATRNKATADSEPLLTSIIGYGETVNLMLHKPSADIDEIRKAIKNISIDSSGIEVTFSAIALAAEQFKHLRENKGSPSERNVMIIVITDERGNDIDYLDQASSLCRRYEIPVYVLGVPAPFGRTHAVIKYIDPRPGANKAARLAAIKQGPETLMPERLQLGYVTNFDQEPLIDSGFGPYSLSRICYDTGGIYFTIHPNRIYNRDIRREETSEYVAFIHRFFDPDIMARYAPDYMSTGEYRRQMARSPMRAALVEAAEMGPVAILEQPTTQFVVNEWSNAATETEFAFEMSNKMRKRLDAMCKILNKGKSARDLESSPRWLAGYDLAYASANAERIRNETYRRMVTKLKRGKKFRNPQNNVWVLEPSNDFPAGDEFENQVKEMREIFERIMHEHKGTPWAYLAEKELARPLGWVWTETKLGMIPQQESPEEASLPTAPAPEAEIVPRPTDLLEPEFKL